MIGDDLRLLHRRKIPNFDQFLQIRVRVSTEIQIPLFSNADQRVIQSKPLDLFDSGLGLSDHGVVEAAAEAAVAREDDDGDLLHRPCCREGEIDVVRLEAVVYVVEDLDEGFGEGTAVDDGLLGAADFGGGDELHGFGDLLDVLHGVDSLPQFSDAAADSRWGSAKCG